MSFMRISIHIYWLLFTVCLGASVYDPKNKDVRSPTGVEMCIALCRNHGKCLSPKVDLKEMSCHLTNGEQGTASDLDLKTIAKIGSSEKKCHGLYRNVLTRHKGYRCLKEMRKPMEIIAITNTSWYLYSEEKNLWKEITEHPAPHDLTYDETTGRIYWILHNKTSDVYQVETSHPSNLSRKTTLYTTLDYACSLALDYKLRVIYVAVSQPKKKTAILLKISEKSKSVRHFKNITAEGVRLIMDPEHKIIYVWCDICNGSYTKGLVGISDNGDRLYLLTAVCMKMYSITFDKKDGQVVFSCKSRTQSFIFHFEPNSYGSFSLAQFFPNGIPVRQTHMNVFVLIQEIIVFLGAGGEIYDRKNRLEGRLPVWDTAETPTRAVVYPVP